MVAPLLKIRIVRTEAFPGELTIIITCDKLTNPKYFVEKGLSVNGVIEAVGQIVAAQISQRAMTSDEIIAEMRKVHRALSALNESATAKTGKQENPVPAVPLKHAFKKSEVLCMLCGKGGMQSLARHLWFAHSMKPKDYRKKFGIPPDQALTAADFSTHRRAVALSYGLAGHLVKARAVRQEQLKAKREQPETRLAESPGAVDDCVSQRRKLAL